ncbi:hypothetical protein [Streptococcus suis]|uniref:hypothetical protein n=1 Tax=Streptococcus suis TaxID=1307 RepID=UPI003908A301
MILNIHELVSKVDGLNSVSTAKNWITMIKEISGYEFPITKFAVGRNRRGRLITNKGYDFTLDDVDDFQRVADKKADIGLKRAIEDVYGNQWEEVRWTTERAVKGLESRYRALSQNYNSLSKEVADLKRDKVVLRNQISDMQERLRAFEEWQKGLPFNLGKKKSGK